jgi:hypothetical protein
MRTRAGGVLDDEERVEPVQGDRVEMKHVAGQDCLGLRSEELRPGRTGPSWRGIDPGGMQDRPDGGGADLVAESGEFTVDAPIAPGRVLGGQPGDQGVEACGNGGSAGAGVRGGPAAVDDVSVPAQDRCGCEQQSAAAMSGQESAEGGDHGSIGPADPGRGRRRLSTAS